MYRAVAPTVLVALVLALFALPASAAQTESARADFIVVLKPSVSHAAPVAAEHASRFGGELRYVYEHALKGYAGTFSEGQLAGILADSRVASIERDGVMTASATQTITDAGLWGLDRIDQRALPLNGSFTYTNTGSGVRAYIIDTGILASHNDFGGRVSGGFTSINDGRGTTDCNGHGTHVAGTVGGATYGVAKSVALIPVRVLACNGSGTTSGVIAGVDWVTANHVKPAVANMSLGGSASSSLDTAVNNSITAGVSYVVAAGNGNIVGIQQDACKYSPARVAAAMTISATDKTDKKASWANYGNCVDWFAPGVGIKSAWYTSNSATNTISGTSMATPHTAGVAALHLQSNPGHTPGQVRDALYALTTKGIVTSSRTTNNHLLFTNH